jgi:hypothetical protein
MGAVPKCEIAIDYEYDRFTHPLPRTVLTVSKYDFGLLKQSLAGGTDCVQEWTLTLSQNI